MLFGTSAHAVVWCVSNKALDTRNFVRNLQKLIEAPPYSIPCKLTMKGLGQATLTLGDK